MSKTKIFSDNDNICATTSEKVKIRCTPSRVAAPEALFQSAQLNSAVDQYDFCTPGQSTGDALLTMENPGLLALRNKTVKPHITSPKAGTRRPASSMNSSLLVKRPLSTLKEPRIPALEKVKREIENEKETIDFKEDPVAYFSKHKDGRGHRFLYLIYAMDPNDPAFSPYNLKKVTSSEITSDYYTMSATGVTHIHPDGTTDTISLDLWAQEISTFNSIRKLHIFSQYFYWKPFKIWKNFVMQQRFGSIDSHIISHPFYKNPAFFSNALSLNEMQSTSHDLVMKYLLSFTANSKFKLDQFDLKNQQNTEILKNQFDGFITTIQKQIMDLYKQISNPALVQVHDSDFPEIKRRNPNLEQLMVLEKRKALARASKTEAVNREIMAIGGFIRMIDYMILESLASSCLEAWRAAESVVVQPDPSIIFQIEELFSDDGQVVFRPSLEELLEAVTTNLHDSVKTLSTLPRLLSAQVLRPLLRDNGLDLNSLFENCMQLYKIVRCKDDLATIEQNIVDIISICYKEAFRASQKDAEFFPIYKMGQTWNVREYIFTASGTYEGPLSAAITDDDQIDDDFLLHPENEPVIDFARVRSDIEKFKSDEQRVNGIRQASSRGPLFIDLKTLKGILTPIPQKALLDLQETLNSLANMKIEKLDHTLKQYGNLLKREPRTLEGYVEYCNTLKRTIKMTTQIQSMIDFVDNLFNMFDDYQFPHATNTLHQSFSQFQQDQANATAIRDSNSGIFTQALKDRVEYMEQHLNKFYEKATSIPISIKDCDIVTKKPAADHLVDKIEKIKPQVDEIILFQQTMGNVMNNFDFYNDVKNASQFAVNLYEAVGQWTTLSEQMSTIAFCNIEMESYKESVNSLYQKCQDLQNNAKNNYPLLAELISKLQEIQPYIEQLDMLAHGKMQQRHWAMLFEQCGRPTNYHPEITIEELLNLGILREKQKIEEITSTSQGESELESEFISITNHWSKVQMPLQDTQIKSEDTLLLASTDSLVSEIQDTLATLARMLSLPYIQGIRDQVTSLQSTLENLLQILEAWQFFQNNWIVLSALFVLDEARSILPHQANRFTAVQRKWSAIARHTLKDTRLFSVCSYPALLEVLTENNAAMESILASLGKFLDAKRAAIPRLYFLSNNEVLNLATASDFSTLSKSLVKIFMHVAKLDIHEGENENETQNMQRIKIYGLIGRDGDSLPFPRHVQCSNTMEQWTASLIETMQHSVRDGVVAAISSFQNGSFIDWALLTPTYICIIAMHIIFCKEIEECFSSFESNPKAFTTYDQVLKRRIDDTQDAFLLPQSARDYQRLASVLTTLLSFRDRLALANDKSANTSPYLRWLSSLRLTYVQATNNIMLECGDFKWEHGYEYWGKMPTLIHTPEIDNAINAINTCWGQYQIPLVNSSATTGKQLMIREIACICGQFTFFVRPFPDLSGYFISRILYGAASTGAWAVFNGIENLSQSCLCFLYDNVRSMMTSLAANNPRITINTKISELNKNCRVLLTSNSSAKSHNEIPTQLRALARPIALQPLKYAKIVEVLLASNGFREARQLAPKFAEYVKQAIRLLQLNCSLMDSFKGIVNSSVAILRKNKGEVSECFALAACCADRFMPLCTNEEVKTSLNGLLFASFNNSASLDNFNDSIHHLRHKKLVDIFKQFAEKEINSFGVELPSRYIVKQACALFNLYMKSNCILLIGPPNSGKSTVFELMCRVFNRDEFRQYATEIFPTEVVPIYPESDSWERLFGSVEEDISLGPIVSFGVLEAAIEKLSSSQKNHESIIKFDGSLSPAFVSFITQFIGSPDLDRFMLTSLDTFLFDSHFKIVIEADSLSNATPSLLSRSSLLLMQNQQQVESVGLIKPAEILQPSIMFSSAARISFDCIDPTNISVVRGLFNEIAPAVVKRLYHTPNYFCHSEASKRVLHGEVYLSDSVPCHAAELAMRMMEDAGVDQTDEYNVKTALVISFMRILDGVLMPDEINSFEAWIRESFNISLPKDWVGFNVPEIFWNTFEKPTLNSVRMFNGNLIPLNFTTLETQPTDNVVGQPQMLPSLQTAILLLKSRQNLVIHGPPSSGKTSFLKVLFNQITSTVPVTITCTKYLTAESLINFLSTHTAVISKLLNQPMVNKTFVLIFDGIDNALPEILEFIRMIITLHTIPLFSTNDQKVFEYAQVHNFQVIATCRDITKLPIRFLKHFAPIQLTPITESNASFIGSTLLQAAGKEKAISDKIMRNIALICESFDHEPASLLKIVPLFSALDLNNDADNVSMLLSEAYYLVLHRHASPAERVSISFRDQLISQGELDSLDSFFKFDVVTYPSIKADSVVVKHSPLSELTKELDYLLAVFNANSVEKLVLKFPEHVVKQWMLVHRAISAPGRHLILKGRTGQGRYSLTRFVAHMCEADFVNISSPSPEEVLAKKERTGTIHAILRDIINNCLQGKRTVAFIRATESNKEEAVFLMRFVSSYDFTTFYSRQQLDELYARLPNHPDKLAAMEQIQASVKQSLHVVIAVDCDGEEFDTLSMDTVYFDSDNAASYASILADVANAVSTKKVTGNLSPSLTNAMIKLVDLARSHIPQFHPNMFYDFCDTFAHFTAVDYQALLLKNENIQAALKFVDKLEAESAAIDKRLDALAPTLQRLQVDSESLQQSYTTRKEAIETRKQKLQEDLASKTDENKQLGNEVSALQAEVESLVPALDKAYSVVEKLPDNEIETIRITATDPLPSQRLMLELLCVMLDLPPSYERNGQKLLMDPKFISTPLSRIGKKIASPKMLANIQPYFTNDNLDPAELESNVPALRNIYDWIEAVIKLSELTEKLNDKKKEYDEKQRQLNEFVEEMNLELASIEQVQQALDGESKTLLQSNAAREQMEKEYSVVDNRKKSIDLIFKGIEQFTEKWSQESKEFPTKREMIIGNSIIFSFYLVFCGMLDVEERSSVLKEVVDQLRQSNIGFSYNNPIESIFDRFISAKPDSYAEASSQQTAIDMHHAKATLRTPLVIDPDGFVLHFLSSSTKLKRLSVISQNCSTLEGSLSSAISDGKTLVLLDVTYLHPLVESILSLSLTKPDQHMSLEMRVGSKMVTWDPNFKLILISPVLSLSEIPDNLLSRVNVINTSTSSLDMTYRSFKQSFIDFFDPDLSPRLLEMQKTELNQRVIIEKYERDTLDILADIVATQAQDENYDYLNDQQTIDDLIKSKDSYISAVSSPVDFTKLREQKKAMIKPFKDHIKLCQTFWRVMSRDLPRVNKSAIFSFSNYQRHIASVFVNDGLHPGALTSDQHTALHASICTATFQYIFQSLSIDESMFFMFLCAYETKREQGKLKESDFKAVLEHIRDEDGESSIDYHSDDSTPGDAFEHLKFTNRVNIFHFISKFIVEQFGPDYPSFFPYFQIDSIITNSASTPSIVLYKERDPTALVQHFITLRSRNENLDSISLSDDPELIRNSRKVITAALNRGNWVILHYTTPSMAAASMITDIFTLMSTTSLNTNFRLIVITNSIKYLSPSMLMKSKRITIDDFPSLRNDMLSLFHHHSAIIRSTTNSRAMKKLAYVCAMGLSLVQYRNFIQPIGFEQTVRPSEMAFKEVIDQLRIMIDAHPNDPPLRNLKKQIVSLIYSGVESEVDLRRIDAQLSALFVPSVLDDGYSILKHSSDPEKWAVPGDIPLASFTQIMQALPMFGSVEALLMPTKVVNSLRKYNMSRWISRPFIQYGCMAHSLSSAKIEGVTALLPERIGTADKRHFQGMMGLFVLHEIDAFNRKLNFVKTRLQEVERRAEIDDEARAVYSGRVPDEWRDELNNRTTYSLNKLASFLIEMHSVLMRWIQEGEQQVVDARYIDRVDELLSTKMMVYAQEHNVSSESLQMECEVTESPPEVTSPGLMYLTHVYLGVASNEDGKVELANANETRAIKAVTALACKIVARSQRSQQTTGFGEKQHTRLYDCPLFREGCRNVENNLICYVGLVTEQTEPELERAGVAMYCRVPDQLE